MSVSSIESARNGARGTAPLAIAIGFGYEPVRMTGHPRLDAIVAGGRTIRTVEPDIYSALAEATTDQRYDRIAGLYDALIGSRLYNRWVWGTLPDDYREFAQAVVDAPPNGLFLDAGCGSMLFTAAAYATTDRPIIAVDKSLEMLRRARTQLQRRQGQVPENVVLLQADLLDLPFQPEQFATVFSMGMLHLFKDGDAMIAALDRMRTAGGRLYVTSLILNNRRGDRWLRVLHNAGEVASLRTSDDVWRLLERATQRTAECHADGNMAYASVSLAPRVR